MRIALLVAMVCIASPAHAFECINRSSLETTAQLTGGTLRDEFLANDGDVAVRALNFLIQPGQSVYGEQMLLWDFGETVVASVMLWRGGGFCLVGQTLLTKLQADSIANAVLR